MEVDEVVDLSVGSRNNIETKSKNATSVPPARGARNGWSSSRRTLRPRTEMSYTELPDIILVPDDIKTNGLPNGSCDDDDEDCKMTYFPPVKELTPSELEEKGRLVRKLKNSLRNEEMVLVLLKKLRQSQQVKENVTVVPPQVNNNNNNNNNSVNNVTIQGVVPVADKQTPPPRQSSKASGTQGVSVSVRGSAVGSSSRGMVQVPPPRVTPPAPPLNRVTVTPRSMPSANVSFEAKKEERPGAAESPAQRQAAAKLALRKQLEKTLLQIPPPKPPPPEMHFIPNPSNTEFIYLVGLEHVVDYITKDCRSPNPPEPFKCSQCSTSFTPVWKWEKGSSKSAREPKVICEQCVTTNVKKALKAEHTNRLKTAFVKALQQEQEIEQRLAQGSPEPPPPKQVAPPPPPVPAAAPAPKAQPPPAPTVSQDKFNSAAAAAAAGLQLLRGGSHHPPLPAHVLPFSPLLYPYQLAMANAKNPSVNLSELQRQVADFQRQYLLEMMPSNARHNNWKL